MRPDIEPNQLDLFDQPIPHSIERLTFNQATRLFRELYWGRKKMASSTRSFERYALKFFDGKYIDTIGRLDMDALLAWAARSGGATQKGLGPSALNKIRMYIGRMFTIFEGCREDGSAGGYITSGMVLPRRNPGRSVKRFKEPTDDRFPKPWEFKAWIRFAKRLGDDSMVDILRLGIWLRLSPIDLENLNDDEIDEARMQIRIFRRHTISDRNPLGCIQVIPITEKIWGKIQTCKRYRRPGVKTILNFRNKRRRLAKLRKLVRIAGMRDFTWRHLRKAGSGHLFNKGVDLQTVSEGLGHTSTRTTRTYYVPRENPNLRKATQVVVDDFNA